MASVDETMLRVQRMLTGPMGLRVQLEQDRFVIAFQKSSTEVTIRLFEWGKDREGNPRTLVVVSAPVLLDVTPSAELYEWVARKGGSRWFGHVEVIDSRTPGLVHLIMSHTLLGDYLDEPELGNALYGILWGADEWDDELKPRFGGRKLIES